MEKAVSGSEKSRQDDLTRRRHKMDATAAMDILQLVPPKNEPKGDFSYTVWPGSAKPLP